MIQGGVILGVPVVAPAIQGVAALATAVATVTEAGAGLLGKNTQDGLHQYLQQGPFLLDPAQGLMLILTQDLVQDPELHCHLLLAENILVEAREEAYLNLAHLRFDLEAVQWTLGNTIENGFLTIPVSWDLRWKKVETSFG